MKNGHSNSLPRHLVGLYLVACLSCLLTIVVMSMHYQAKGTLERLAPIVLISPFIIVVLGIVLIRKAIASHAQIESQLKRIAASSPVDWTTLHPIESAASEAISGWNRVVDSLKGKHSLDRIEQHLAAKHQTGSDSDLETWLDALPEGVGVTDADGQLEFGNRSLASLVFRDKHLAKTPDKANLLETVMALAPTRQDELRRKFFSATRSTVIELQLGETISSGVLRIARYPVDSSTSHRPKFLWAVRDITQQKMAEATRSDFVVTAAHELRTPLTNIKAYAETLAEFEDIEPDQQKEFYNIINSEASRLSRFIDDLLNVSQMESGTTLLARHETDVMRLLEEVIEHVTPEISRKQIQFESVIPPKLPKLTVDKDKITAALVNLLGNAVKYTDSGGQVRLEVEVGQGLLQLHFEDTGIGIAQQDLGKVFEKFYRSDDSRVRSINGSGLGLSFTKEVARLHGGSVTVESELNVGSRFTLTLPLDAPMKPVSLS